MLIARGNDGGIFFREQAEKNRRHADEGDCHHQHHEQQQLTCEFAGEGPVDQVTNTRSKLFQRSEHSAWSGK